MCLTSTLPVLSLALNVRGGCLHPALSLHPSPTAPMLLSLLSPHPRKVILPSNYSTCKSKRGAHSSEINQYKLKGHPVCFCNNAL